MKITVFSATIRVILTFSMTILFYGGVSAQTTTDSILQQKDSLQELRDTVSYSVPMDSIVQRSATNHPKSIQKNWVLEGVVLDATTAEPLSFATIYFAGTQIGQKTNEDGKFRFDLDHKPGDTLVVSIIGYAKKYVLLATIQSNPYLRISMERSNIQMQDVVLKFSRDPALALVKKVILKKPYNNYDKAGNYRYEVYNKLELDISKIPPKAFKQSKLLKQFNFIQDFIDSSSEEKPFLPLFLTETLSDFYYQHKPKKSKEFIKGSRISGYKNQSVSQMLGSMYQNINIYENSIPIFDVAFVSPIANDAPSFYRYQLVDTQVVDGRTCYKVAFVPKRKGEHTFNGDMWIHESDFAVQKINMIVTKDQQMNWVNKVTMLQEFTCLEDTLWFLTKDKFYVDFLPPQGDKIAGFLGRKTTTYKNIVVNDPYNEEVLNDKNHKASLELDPDALNRDETYWNEVRHDSLSKNEKAIYKMIDTIQRLPVYKTYYSLFYFLGTGIKEVGPLELGSIYNIYSRNPIEGNRFRFNIGTTPKLFKDIYLRGYVAYGTLDERIKYAGSALWLIKRKPRMYVFAEFKHDLENTVNQYDNSASIDNIFSSIGRKSGVPWKLAFVDKQRVEFFNSFFNGFSYQFSAERRQFSPYSPLPSAGIFYTGDSTPSRRVISNEIGLELRFAYKEQFVEGNYYRTSLGTTYPLVTAYIGHGFKGLLGGNYRYLKVRASISDHQKIRRMGSLYYNVFAGKVWGNLPYPLLEIHPGNEFYYYNSRVFNMMYRYEYISDTYAGVIMEHSTGSLFFKYIPYLQKMKLRTFWNAKGVYGGLSAVNQQINLNQGYTFQTLTRSPYLEVGTGIENIFKILRVDFVWRLMPYRKDMDSPARRFGVFGSVKFVF